MYESGYYPAGAEFDPRAPWNEREPTMVYAYDFEADYETECSEEVWNMLPETEEEAEAKGEHIIKGEKETCEVCDGEGEVEYEPDYDDYDED